MRSVRGLTLVACTLASALCAARADDSCDVLALARLAEESGDAQLAAQMGGRDREAALIAVRASEFAAAPELLVPALARLACGRDAALAPEAARVLRQLATRLSPSALAAREVLVSDLEAARAALGCARTQPVPRADIVTALELLGEALSRSGG